MRSPLLTAALTFDLSAIMSRAWIKARHAVKVGLRFDPSLTLREAFKAALREGWSEARSALSYVRWAAEQDRAIEARKALDARNREIEELRFARVAADGIHRTRAFFATARCPARRTGSALMCRPARRERLLAFIKPWSDAREEYRGSFGFGPLDLRFITDEGLEAIASRIIYDFWRRRAERARQRAVHRHAA